MLRLSQDALPDGSGMDQIQRSTDRQDAMRHLSAELFALDGRVAREMHQMRADQDVLARGLTELEDQLLQRLNDLAEETERNSMRLEGMDSTTNPRAVVKEEREKSATAVKVEEMETVLMELRESNNKRSLLQAEHEEQMLKMNTLANKNAGALGVADEKTAKRMDICERMSRDCERNLESLLTHVEEHSGRFVALERKADETADLCQKVLHSMSQQMREFHGKLKKHESDVQQRLLLSEARGDDALSKVEQVMLGKRKEEQLNGSSGRAGAGLVPGGPAAAELQLAVTESNRKLALQLEEMQNEQDRSRRDVRSRLFELESQVTQLDQNSRASLLQLSDLCDASIKRAVDRLREELQQQSASTPSADRRMTPRAVKDREDTSENHTSQMNQHQIISTTLASSSSCTSATAQECEALQRENRELKHEVGNLRQELEQKTKFDVEKFADLEFQLRKLQVAQVEMKKDDNSPLAQPRTSGKAETAVEAIKEGGKLSARVGRMENALRDFHSSMAEARLARLESMIDSQKEDDVGKAARIVENKLSRLESRVEKRFTELHDSLDHKGREKTTEALRSRLAQLETDGLEVSKRAEIDIRKNVEKQVKGLLGTQDAAIEDRMRRFEAEAMEIILAESAKNFSSIDLPSAAEVVRRGEKHSKETSSTGVGGASGPSSTTTTTTTSAVAIPSTLSRVNDVDVEEVSKRIELQIRDKLEQTLRLKMKDLESDVLSLETRFEDLVVRLAAIETRRYLREEDSTKVKVEQATQVETATAAAASAVDLQGSSLATLSQNTVDLQTEQMKVFVEQQLLSQSQMLEKRMADSQAIEVRKLHEIHRGLESRVMEMSTEQRALSLGLSRELPGVKERLTALAHLVNGAISQATAAHNVAHKVSHSLRQQELRLAQEEEERNNTLAETSSGHTTSKNSQHLVPVTPRLEEVTGTMEKKMAVLERSLKTVVAQATQDNTEAFRILLQMVKSERSKSVPPGSGRFSSRGEPETSSPEVDAVMDIGQERAEDVRGRRSTTIVPGGGRLSYIKNAAAEVRANKRFSFATPVATSNVEGDANDDQDGSARSEDRIASTTSAVAQRFFPNAAGATTAAAKARSRSLSANKTRGILKTSSRPLANYTFGGSTSSSLPSGTSAEVLGQRQEPQPTWRMNLGETDVFNKVVHQHASYYQNLEDINSAVYSSSMGGAEERRNLREETRRPDGLLGDPERSQSTERKISGNQLLASLSSSSAAYKISEVAPLPSSQEQEPQRANKRVHLEFQQDDAAPKARVVEPESVPLQRPFNFPKVVVQPFASSSSTTPLKPKVSSGPALLAAEAIHTRPLEPVVDTRRVAGLDTINVSSKEQLGDHIDHSETTISATLQDVFPRPEETSEAPLEDHSSATTPKFDKSTGAYRIFPLPGTLSGSNKLLPVKPSKDSSVSTQVGDSCSNSVSFSGGSSSKESVARTSAPIKTSARVSTAGVI
ncbi:unnamed protein product [Amoebophrya sp. A25]|nr:unnamed protein product [Amoebophrya sp. A25]|eukprot:GSA25T00025676001.1